MIRVYVEKPRCVCGDGQPLRQALGNLVDNALRYGAGEILLRARPAGPGLQSANSAEKPSPSSDTSSFALGDGTHRSGRCLGWSSSDNGANGKAEAAADMGVDDGPNAFRRTTRFSRRSVYSRRPTPPFYSEESVVGQLALEQPLQQVGRRGSRPAEGR